MNTLEQEVMCVINNIITDVEKKSLGVDQSIFLPTQPLTTSSGYLNTILEVSHDNDNKIYDFLYSDAFLPKDAEFSSNEFNQSKKNSNLHYSNEFETFCRIPESLRTTSRTYPDILAELELKPISTNYSTRKETKPRCEKVLSRDKIEAKKSVMEFPKGNCLNKRGPMKTKSSRELKELQKSTHSYLQSRPLTPNATLYLDSDKLSREERSLQRSLITINETAQNSRAKKRSQRPSQKSKKTALRIRKTHSNIKKQSNRRQKYCDKDRTSIIELSKRKTVNNSTQRKRNEKKINPILISAPLNLLDDVRSASDETENLSLADTHSHDKQLFRSNNPECKRNVYSNDFFNEVSSSSINDTISVMLSGDTNMCRNVKRNFRDVLHHGVAGNDIYYTRSLLNYSSCLNSKDCFSNYPVSYVNHPGMQAFLESVVKDYNDICPDDSKSLQPFGGSLTLEENRLCDKFDVFFNNRLCSYTSNDNVFIDSHKNVPDIPLYHVYHEYSKKFITCVLVFDVVQELGITNIESFYKSHCNRLTFIAIPWKYVKKFCDENGVGKPCRWMPKTKKNLESVADAIVYDKHLAALLNVEILQVKKSKRPWKEADKIQNDIKFWNFIDLTTVVPPKNKAPMINAPSYKFKNDSLAFHNDKPKVALTGDSSRLIQLTKFAAKKASRDDSDNIRLTSGERNLLEKTFIGKSTVTPILSNSKLEKVHGIYTNRKQVTKVQSISAISSNSSQSKKYIAKKSTRKRKRIYSDKNDVNQTSNVYSARKNLKKLLDTQNKFLSSKLATNANISSYIKKSPPDLRQLCDISDSSPSTSSGQNDSFCDYSNINIIETDADELPTVTEVLPIVSEVTSFSNNIYFPSKPAVSTNKFIKSTTSQMIPISDPISSVPQITNLSVMPVSKAFPQVPNSISKYSVLTASSSRRNTLSQPLYGKPLHVASMPNNGSYIAQVVKSAAVSKTSAVHYSSTVVTTASLSTLNFSTSSSISSLHHNPYTRQISESLTVPSTSAVQHSSTSPPNAPVPTVNCVTYSFVQSDHHYPSLTVHSHPAKYRNRSNREFINRECTSSTAQATVMGNSYLSPSYFASRFNGNQYHKQNFSTATCLPNPPHYTNYPLVQRNETLPYLIYNNNYLPQSHCYSSLSLHSNCQTGSVTGQNLSQTTDRISKYALSNPQKKLASRGTHYLHSYTGGKRADINKNKIYIDNTKQKLTFLENGQPVLLQDDD